MDFATFEWRWEVEELTTFKDQNHSTVLDSTSADSWHYDDILTNMVILRSTERHLILILIIDWLMNIGPLKTTILNSSKTQHQCHRTATFKQFPPKKCSICTSATPENGNGEVGGHWCQSLVFLTWQAELIFFRRLFGLKTWKDGTFSAENSGWKLFHVFKWNGPLEI